MSYEELELFGGWAQFDYRCMAAVVDEISAQYFYEVKEMWRKRPMDTVPYIYRRKAYRNISLQCGVNAMFNARHLIKERFDLMDKLAKEGVQ